MKKMLLTVCIMMVCGQLFAQSNDSLQTSIDSVAAEGQKDYLQTSDSIQTQIEPLAAEEQKDYHQSNDSLQTRIDSLENEIKTLSASIKEKDTETEKKEKDHSVWGHKKFLSIGYVNQTLSPNYGDDLKGSFGVSLVSGRTIYLHKKPLWNRVKFAIDLGCDINYTKYKDYDEEYNGYYEDEETPSLISGMHQCDIGFVIGPSITVNPVGDLRVSAYFRFVPSYSMLIIDDEVNGSYVSFFTYGGEVSWKAIGIGVEGRFGNGKYGAIMSDDDVSDIKQKYSTTSFRAYLCFRF